MPIVLSRPFRGYLLVAGRTLDEFARVGIDQDDVPVGSSLATALRSVRHNQRSGHAHDPAQTRFGRRRIGENHFGQDCLEDGTPGCLLQGGLFRLALGDLGWVPREGVEHDYPGLRKPFRRNARHRRAYFGMQQSNGRKDEDGGQGESSKTDGGLTHRPYNGWAGLKFQGCRWVRCSLSRSVKAAMALLTPVL
jgi:hypothetical protein